MASKQPQVREREANWKPTRETYAYDMGQWGDGNWIGTVGGMDVLGVTREAALQEAQLLARYGGATHTKQWFTAPDGSLTGLGALSPEGSLDDWGTHLLLFEIVVSEGAAQPHRHSVSERDVARWVAAEYAFQQGQPPNDAVKILKRFAAKPEFERAQMIAEAIRSAQRRGVRVDTPPGGNPRRKKPKPKKKDRRKLLNRLLRGT